MAVLAAKAEARNGRVVGAGSGVGAAMRIRFTIGIASGTGVLLVPPITPTPGLAGAQSGLAGTELGCGLAGAQSGLTGAQSGLAGTEPGCGPVGAQAELVDA